MKTVLITGASSGIGKKIAYEMAAHHHNLLLVARRKNLLEEVQKDIEEKYDVKVSIFVCDLTRNSKEVYDFCKKKKIRIDVLVNNAGYGDYGKFIQANLDKTLGMIDLNNKALVELTYYFILDMKENGYGHVINVGSVASFVPGPNMAVYYATKSFVMSFSLALREELKSHNIRVSVICPAPTKTDFWTVAGGETSSVYNNVFARSDEDAAKTTYRMYEKNKAYAIDGTAYRLLIGVARHLPLELVSKAVGYIQEKTKENKQ